MKHNNDHTIRLASVLAMMAAFSIPGTAKAQDASLFHNVPAASQGLTLENSSFVYRKLPPEARPRELQKHDIITVLVDFRSRFLSEGDAQNRKTSNISAVLADWIQLDSGSLKPSIQANGDPTVTGTLNSQTQVQADVELRDSLTFRMAATIVDIRPNGNLVIEGHLNIRNNEEHWQISITGVVRREAIQADRTVSSDAITQLSIDKKEVGQVRDGYARGWLAKFYGRFKPF